MASVFDQTAEPVPVGSLLRKEAGMLEAEGFQIEGERGGAAEGIADGPLLRKIPEFPFSSALFTPVVMTVRLLPAGQCARCIPDDLGIRAYQLVRAPAFQLFSFGSIQYFIISPVVGDPHKILLFS